MQNKGNQKKTVEEVKKPILTGSWHGKDAWKLALKRALTMLVVIFVYLIAGIMFTFNSFWGRILSSLFIVFVVAYYLYASGVGQGQTDAAFGEILYTRREEGHEVPEADRERSFHPLKGLFAVLVGALPFVLFALVFACITQATSYRLGTLPAWTEGLMAQSEFGAALEYYNLRPGMSVVDVMRVVDRAMIMPFINIAATQGSEALLWTERLSPLLVLIAPLGYALGYAQGVNVRTRINTGIKMGDDKKKRKERKARKQRQRSKTPERLI